MLCRIEEKIEEKMVFVNPSQTVNELSKLPRYARLNAIVSRTYQLTSVTKITVENIISALELEK